MGASPLSQTETTYSVDYSIKKAEDIADQKRAEAQRKADLINSYFNKGKACYQSRRYNEAKKYFEDILDLDPTYEPAKLYLESSIIHLEILKNQDEINEIKLKMADIIAEYERRREEVDGLTMRYFLEQAQRKCQLGDYKGAEEFYNLCYKIDPYSKDKIEWFTKATYDLIKLSQALQEHNERIEELAVFEP